MFERFRKLLRPVYQSVGWDFASREKRKLRKEVSKLPLTASYPHDPEAKLLRAIGINGQPMFDIGANTGIYSTALEDVVGSSNLYLFEPIPKLCQHLKERFATAHIFQLALSDHEGTQLLRVPIIKGTRFHTRATLNQHIEPDQTGFDEIEVQLAPLDSVVQGLRIKSLGLMKIDVEGHELEVIRGAADTISRFKPWILVEIEARHHQNSISEVFDELQDKGFLGYYLDPMALDLRKLHQFDEERDQNINNLVSRDFIRYLNNFFFVHSSKCDDFVAKVSVFLEGENRLRQRLSANVDS